MNRGLTRQRVRLTYAVTKTTYVQFTPARFAAAGFCVLGRTPC